MEVYEMKVEAMSSVSSSYSGQGSQGSGATQAAAESPVVEQETKQPTPVASAANAGTPSGKTGYEITDPQKDRENRQASSEQIKQAVDTINKNTQSEAVFGIHEATHRVTIKIIDKQTKEVIKEFPPEKTLDMIAKVWEMAGIMVDERR
jgi:flagellar protein FlaG